MSFSSDTNGYLHQEVLKNAKYLVVTVDKYGLVARQECPGSRWRMEGLKTGRPLPENLHGIIDASAAATTPQMFPYVQLTDSLFADVHVLNTGEEKQLILQDVSAGHGEEYKLQQKAHEVSLLLEHQAELNKELAEKRLEAERASKAKSDFIASMSHEFRSPITSLMGHVEMLRNDLPDSTRTAAIQRATWHLLTLVENLLEQARTGEGVVYLNISPLNMRDIAADMKELFSVQAQARGLTFTVELSDDLEKIYGDDLRLRQVLINLISNAIRYTEIGTVTLSCLKDNDRVRFKIADTGIGISEGDKERIFDAFVRAKPEGRGTGLGLTISRQLVDIMGGELTLDSELGKGSTFVFCLPVGTSADSDIKGSLEGTKMLLVEDDDDLREMYRIFLEDWGVNVSAVANCLAARKVISEKPFDIIMADFNLPDGNGIEIVEEFRKSNPDASSVICSGSGSAGDGQPLDPSCADVLMVKPISSAYLKSVILNTLGIKQS